MARLASLPVVMLDKAYLTPPEGFPHVFADGATVKTARFSEADDDGEEVDVLRGESPAPAAAEEVQKIVHLAAMAERAAEAGTTAAEELTVLRRKCREQEAALRTLEHTVSQAIAKLKAKSADVDDLVQELEKRDAEMREAGAQRKELAETNEQLRHDVDEAYEEMRRLSILVTKSETEKLELEAKVFSLEKTAEDKRSDRLVEAMEGFLTKFGRAVDAQETLVRSVQASPTRAVSEDSIESVIVTGGKSFAEVELAKADAKHELPWLEFYRSLSANKGLLKEKKATLVEFFPSPQGFAFQAIVAVLFPNVTNVANIVSLAAEFEIIATVQNVLAAMVCHVFFGRHQQEHGREHFEEFIREKKKVTKESLLGLFRYVLGYGGSLAKHDDLRLMLLSAELFEEHWGGKFTKPQPTQEEGAFRDWEQSCVMWTMAHVGKISESGLSRAVWRERLKPKHELPCVPPLHIRLPMAGGKLQSFRLVWKFECES